jgi:sulfofructose kinase
VTATADAGGAAHAAERPPLTVFAGAATYDAIAVVDGYPGPDERRVAEDLVFSGGGPAATAAVACARLGVPAAFVGAVGDDAEGELVRAGLAAEGVDVSGLATVAGRRTGASVVVVDRGRATRAICTRPTAPFDVPAGSVAAALLRRADWVHVDHLGWGCVQDVLASAGPRRARLSVDAGNPIPAFTPRGVDLYVPTVEALARSYPGVGSDVDALLAAAVRDGARTVVATRGSRGSVAATAAGERVDAPGLAVTPLSTLGAGDVFHGALLAALVRGEPLAACLRYANAAAALSCRGLDGRSAIPGHEEAAHAAHALAPAGTS